MIFSQSVQVTRTDWSREPNNSKLAKAIRDYLRDPEQFPSKNQYAKVCGIPKGVLQPYLSEDKSKRKKLEDTTGLGCMHSINPTDQTAIIDTLVLKDRLSKAECNGAGIVAVGEANPSLVLSQCRNVWNRLKKSSSNRLRNYTVQATTNDRAV